MVTRSLLLLRLRNDVAEVDANIPITQIDTPRSANRQDFVLSECSRGSRRRLDFWRWFWCVSGSMERCLTLSRGERMRLSFACPWRQPATVFRMVLIEGLVLTVQAL